MSGSLGVQALAAEVLAAAHRAGEISAGPGRWEVLYQGVFF